MNQWATWSVHLFNAGILMYFLALNSLYLLFTVIAFICLYRDTRRWTARELSAVLRSPATPAISIVVPAYNEQGSIVDSVRSLLMLNYPAFEVVLVNDGSTDGTLQTAIEAFEFVEVPLAAVSRIESKPIRAVYRSLTNPDLVLVDKENGGKADAMNAGTRYACHPLVCLIDADSLLDDQALVRAVLPFIEDPRTVGAGGIIRIANGCAVRHGRVVEVGLSHSPLACFQVLEYLRAFLAGRVAHAAMNGLIIISGAFGLFRRDVLEDVGGYRTGTNAEDMELVVRLHRELRQRHRPYRLSFRSDPICWTEAPERLRGLAVQRNRWQRGTLNVMRMHWAMIGNPRYGVVGLLMMPFYFVFEALGPIIECAGYLVTGIALALGLLDWRAAQLFFLVAVVYGTLLSLAAVVLEELSYRRYPRLGHLVTLTMYALLENFGYRQLTTVWRVKGTVDYLRGKQSWGTIERLGFTKG